MRVGHVIPAARVSNVKGAEVAESDKPMSAPLSPTPPLYNCGNRQQRVIQMVFFSAVLPVVNKLFEEYLSPADLS